ncbi:MAG: hypothetical protein JW955_01490 [Sedimentisphaerales bacterium]|nr:hypothetical protein [Sedimentisphaerales bacterium]
MAILILWLAGGTGCKTAPDQERQIWQQIKLGDLAPTVREDDREQAQFLATVHMEVRVFDLPGENVEQIDDLWRLLSPKFVYMTSYNAFTDNSFRVKFGRVEAWEKIQQILAEAGAQRTATLSLTVPDNDTSDMPIADLPTGKVIAFVGNDLSSQTVNVGPGSLVLRLRAEPISWVRGVRKIIAYPTYTLPTNSAIPQLRAIARKREFYFPPAAFAAQMGPGDLVVLGPDQYTGEQLTLGGLFFNNPAGRLFFNPAKPTPPQQKPATRLYVLVCRSISD